MIVNGHPTRVKTGNRYAHVMLSWINNCLQSTYSNIEELCTGTAYCLYMDKFFPGKVDMNRVKFHSNLEQDYTQNFILLQAAFKRMGIDKSIPIVKLIKGQFKDNFEFLQWFKEFFEVYEGARHLGNRVRLDTQNVFAYNIKGSRENETSANVSHINSDASEVVQSTPVPVNTPSNVASGTGLTDLNREPTSVNKSGAAKKRTKTNSKKAMRKQELKQLSRQVSDILSNIEILQKERDLYLSKLRDIEILCQAEVGDTHPLLGKCLKIVKAKKDGLASTKKTSTRSRRI